MMMEVLLGTQKHLKVSRHKVSHLKVSFFRKSHAPFCFKEKSGLIEDDLFDSNQLSQNFIWRN